MEDQLLQIRKNCLKHFQKWATESSSRTNNQMGCMRCQAAEVAGDSGYILH